MGFSHSLSAGLGFGAEEACMRFGIALLGALLALPLLGSCAGQQTKFDSLNERDKLRFAACRHDIARALCPDDPDCAIKAAEWYASEPPSDRRRWLRDYKCPPEKIDHADTTLDEKERESIGLKK
jgi:hypothetical protein